MATVNKNVNEEVKEKDTVVVRLPKTRDEEGDWVGWINSNRYVIKRGVAVEIPKELAEIIERQDEALERIEAFENAHAVK